MVAVVVVRVTKVVVLVGVGVLVVVRVLVVPGRSPPKANTRLSKKPWLP